MSSGDENTPSAMWSAVLLITLQSFLFGYCFSSLNPCLVTGDSTSGSACFHGTDSGCPKGTIYNDLNLSTIEAQTATSLTVAAAWIGCMIGSYPSERYGRKITLLANNLFFIAGSAIAASGSLPALFVGRTIIGFGVGICSVVPPVLLSEISSQATRGMFTTFHQLMLTLAIFTVNIIGFGLVTYVNHGWQYVQGLAIVPAVIMLVMHSYIPESPKWLIAQYSADTNGSAGVGSGNPLIHHGDDSIATPEFHQSSAVAKTTSFGSNASDVQHPFFQQAKSTLVRLRGVEVDVSEELNGLLQEVSGDKNADRNVSWAEVFACKEAMVIGCGLLFFQAFTGINTVVFYSTTIFGLAGFKDSIIGSACWSFVNFLMTGVAARLIDSAGRRILLLRGTYVMLGALVLLAAILLADVQAKTQGDIAVLAVLIYVCGYAVSLGAVPWTIISEIMPTRQRMKAVSLFLSINWGANLLIGLLTLTAIDSLGGVKKSMTDDETAAAETKGVGYLYLIFGVVTACCVLFITFFVPETKGKSPEQLNKPLLQGVDGRGTEESDYLVAPRSTSGQKQYI